MSLTPPRGRGMFGRDTTRASQRRATSMLAFSTGSPDGDVLNDGSGGNSSDLQFKTALVYSRNGTSLGALDPLHWSSTAWDTESWFDGDTAFVLTETGIYSVDFKVGWTDASLGLGDRLEADILYNGATVSVSFSAVSSGVPGFLSVGGRQLIDVDAAFLAAGGTVELLASNDPVGSYSIHPDRYSTWFSITKIGELA